MNTVRKIAVRKRIALVDHDNEKHDWIEWAEHNKTTLPSMSLWGYQQIGAKIAEGKVAGLQQLYDRRIANLH